MAIIVPDVLSFGMISRPPIRAHFQLPVVARSARCRYSTAPNLPGDPVDSTLEGVVFGRISVLNRAKLQDSPEYLDSASGSELS